MCVLFCFCLSLPLSHVFNHCIPALRSLEDLGESETEASGLKELPVSGGACVAMWGLVPIQNALELQDGVWKIYMHDSRGGFVCLRQVL